VAVPANVADIRFARQTAGQGTPIAAPTATDYGLFVAGGSMIRPNRVDEPFEETTGGQMRSDRYVSTIHAEGEPEFYLMPKSAAAMLYGVLGAKAVSGAGDPWTHTLTFGSSRPWWTVWRALGGLIFERFPDCKFDRIAIRSEYGKPATITARIIGLNAQWASAAEAQPTIEVTHRIMHADAVAAFMVEGAAVASTREFEIVIDRNGDPVGGDDYRPIDIFEGEFTVQVTLGQLYLANSLRNRLMYGGASPADNTSVVSAILELAGAPAGIQVLYTRGGSVPVSPARSIQINVPRVALAPIEPEHATGSEPLRQTVTVNALQPAAAATPMTCVVKNGESTIA